MRLFILLFVLGMWLIIGIEAGYSEDLIWERISRDIQEVNVVYVDNQNAQIIIIGTDQGVFKSKDGGKSWQAILYGANKKVNFLYVEESDKDLIYAGCTSGLFLSLNQGKRWQLIYQGDSEEKSNCLSLVTLNDNELYLGIEAGLFRSQDNGRIWQRFSNRFNDLSILAMDIDREKQSVCLITPSEAYRIDPEGGIKKIFTFQSIISDNRDTEDIDSQDEDAEFYYQINDICIDLNNSQNIYIATSQGLFESNDRGRSWRRLPDFGLLNKRVRVVMVLEDSVLYVATDSGVFSYNRNRWKEETLRLPMQDIRDLTMDSHGRIYIAGDRGLFRSLGYSNRAPASLEMRKEPSVQQVQQAAIKYAHVVDPRCIASHRDLARFKAFLPDLSLDYDKTISTYNNSTTSRFSVGPRDWSASLKWNLSDLVWSEQQRLIDSQVRLMVKLRQDILDEVTRLYFELRRLQLELISSHNLELKDRQDKKLRIEELTALLDGFTGGYFSSFALTE